MKQKSLIAKEWRDSTRLADGLTKTFLFIESFNTYCAKRILTHPGRQLSTSSSLLAFSKFMLERTTWPDWTESARLFAKAKVCPTYDPEFFELLTEILLEPAKVRRDDFGQWRISGSSRLPRVRFPVHLSNSVWSYGVSNGGFFAFSQRELPIDGLTSQGERKIWFWDQVVDPIATCHRVLMDLYPGRHCVEHAEFLLQKAFKHQFGLKRFTHDVKFLLSAIALEFNNLFYGSLSPRVEEVQGAPSATLGTSLIIKRFEEVLESAYEGEPLSKEVTQQRALGLLVFARFCRVLRVRYFLLPEDIDYKTSTRSVPQNRQNEIKQCLAAIRPLEYGYFLNRVFGSISEIPGLNFIFRGGLLRRPKTGRVLVVNGPPGSGKTVFALQKLCGIASRGGLAVYFSFEERTDLLVDRLVAFGLYDRDRFTVINSDKDIVRTLRPGPQDGRGALLLFTLGMISEYSLLGAIQALATLETWPWRALVVDSINALDYQIERGTAGKDLEGEVDRDRLAARELIEAIENNGFLGIVLSEDPSSRFKDLSYVADTVVKFGFDQGDRGRWLEIKKCRSQNFHGGRHKLRFVEGEGLSVIPSLGSIRSALRRRTKSTLSKERVIPVRWPTANNRRNVDLAEKCSALIFGFHGQGKTSLLLSLATEPTRLLGIASGSSPEPPRAILVVNFRTTEERFQRVLRVEPNILKRWQRIRSTHVRWFSPGTTLTGDEVVWEIWNLIQRARRGGLPIDRIVIDEVENAVVALPSVANEPLFWTTLLQMTAAEAITTFLGLSLEDSYLDSDLAKALYALRSETDYVLRVGPLQQPFSEREGGPTSAHDLLPQARELSSSPSTTQSQRSKVRDTCFVMEKWPKEVGEEIIREGQEAGEETQAEEEEIVIDETHDHDAE